MTTKPVPPGTRPEGARDEGEAARAVQVMFSRIAPRYDFLNRLLSFSLDKSWRSRTARALAPRLASPDSRALDLCCGTADLALELARVSPGLVVGVDFAHPMLVLARGKTQGLRLRIPVIEGDALQLPFPDNCFDVVTAAFGFRNLANYDRGLAEICRVLKRGGEAGILEFALPSGGVFGWLYTIYFRRILPRIGELISGARGPYSYLPASVEQFPACDEFARWMERAGFASVSSQTWTGGAVALHRGRKP